MIQKKLKKRKTMEKEYDYKKHENTLKTSKKAKKKEDMRCCKANRR